MNSITEILNSVGDDDAQTAKRLLPLVYDGLRQVARAKLAREKPGHTLQATALVHEAYLRLVGKEAGLHWNSRRHFFAAAAEAMRRILIENARSRATRKRGGDVWRVELNPDLAMDANVDQRLLDLDEALIKLESIDPRKAQLVKLRFYAGLTLEDAAQALDISAATAARDWVYSRAWLKREVSK